MHHHLWCCTMKGRRIQLVKKLEFRCWMRNIVICCVLLKNIVICYPVSSLNQGFEVVSIAMLYCRCRSIRCDDAMSFSIHIINMIAGTELCAVSNSICFHLTWFTTVIDSFVLSHQLFLRNSFNKYVLFIRNPPREVQTKLNSWSFRVDHETLYSIESFYRHCFFQKSYYS